MSSGAGAGIRVSRRGLLIVGVSASLAPIASLCTGRPARAQTLGELTFDEFIAIARAELKDLLPSTDATQRDAYVHRAAAFLQRLEAVPPQEFNGSRPLDIRVVGKPMVFSVTVLRGLPGAIQQAHNHPGYSVATMGLAGEVRVRNFEHEGAPPPYDSAERFKLRQTSEHMLGARDVVTLTPDRDNIHTFEAGPDGALWIDISTLHAEPGSTKFSYLRLHSDGGARVGDLHEGTWGRD
jgi:hypothetical protein